MRETYNAAPLDLSFGLATTMIVYAIVGLFTVKRGEVNSKLSMLELITLKQPARGHLFLSSSLFTFGFVYLLTGITSYETAIVAFISLAAWECANISCSRMVVGVCGLVG